MHAALSPRRLTASAKRAVAVTHDPDRKVGAGGACMHTQRGRWVGVRVGHRRGSIFPLGRHPPPSGRGLKEEDPGIKRGACASE